MESVCLILHSKVEIVVSVRLFSLFSSFQSYLQVSFSVVRSLSAKKPLFVQYNTIQYYLFNEGDAGNNPRSYLTYGPHNNTKYTYKNMPNQ